jgi:hypothetical protein
MEGLFKIMKWVASGKINDEEFSSLYQEWLDSYNIQQLISTQSNPYIDEVFTFFIIL